MIKLLKHLKIVNKHRFYVFIHMARMGFLFQGLRHDLSKYSFSELLPSAKYFQGDKSPVYKQRQDNKIYSLIAVTHTRKNKHHYEYWIDIYKNNVVLKMMPYKYAIEYAADVIAASKAYNKKEFNRNMPYDYFINHTSYSPMHKGTREFVLSLLKLYAESGFKYLNRKNTKNIYNEIYNRHEEVEIHPINLDEDIKIEIN